MITSLLSKKPTKKLRKIGASPRIDEVTPSSGASGASGASGDGGDAGVDGESGEGSDTGGDAGEESDEFDWEVEQQLTTDENDVCLYYFH